jgi:hypothetical protein
LADTNPKTPKPQNPTLLIIWKFINFIKKFKDYQTSEWLVKI